MSVFRIATKQAIREIFEENAAQNRFGFTVTDDNLESITDRVVDLFEMTLSLRSRIASAPARAPEPEPAPEQPRSRWRTETTPTLTRASFPTTKNAAEIYEKSWDAKRSDASETRLPPQSNFKLPRKRTELTAEEKEKLTRPS